MADANFEQHVALAEQLERDGILPVTFMLLQPASWHEDVWTDVARMRTMNMLQAQRGAEMHLCLARGSRVLTKERGYIPIEEVAVGEHALTHKGRWRPVLASQSTGTRPAVTLRAQGVPGLTLTPDHKLWARKSDWIRSRDGAARATPGWIEARQMVAGYVNLKLPPTEQPAVTNLDHWWIVGRWLADGHWEKRGAAIISCGAHEHAALTKTLGARAGGAYVGATAVQIRVLDPDGSLKSTLRRCGRGAATKHLPPEAYTLPIAPARALLSGYLSGDGHLVNGRGRWVVNAVGRDLLLGIGLLAQRVHGAIASLYEGRPARAATIAGRVVRCRQEWVLSFDLASPRRKKPFVMDDGSWRKVRSIEDAGEIETWSLRVEEDESYTAEGAIVKNCPLQFDIVDRLVTQFSMPGEVVYDPFAGIGTVPYCAMKLKRRGLGVELNPRYFADAAGYCEAMARKLSTPTLFDIANA